MTMKQKKRSNEKKNTNKRNITSKKGLAIKFSLQNLAHYGIAIEFVKTLQ